MLDASKPEGPDGGDPPRRRSIPRAAKKHRGPLQPAAFFLKASSKEYCSTAAIHGVRYFVEDGRTLFERLFWALSLTVSLIGCAIMVQKVYHKWGSNPVIVGPAETPRLTSEVPFPAVTICPETKWPRSEFNFTAVGLRLRNNDSVSDEELNMFATANIICPYWFSTPRNATITSARLYSVFELAEHVGNRNCRFDDSTFCEFHPFISDDGPCFTFNMLSSRELFTPAAVQYNETGGTASAGWSTETWTLNQGEAENATFPWRTHRLGHRSGLKIRLVGNTSDTDYGCRGGAQGYKVILHSPAEIPNINGQYYRVAHNQDLNVAVTASIMTTDDDVKGYTPDVRYCYFQNERPLQFFKIYSQIHCEMECMANYTVKMCQCAKYYMPRSANTTICGATEHDRYCLYSAHANESKIKDSCDCLPACTVLEYNAHTVKSDFEWEKYFATLGEEYKDLGAGDALSHVYVFFTDRHFIPNVRQQNEFYGLTDFLASCGGLLSLFNGFSIISLVEIVYYATIRLWCHVYRARHRRTADVADASQDVEKQKETEA